MEQDCHFIKHPYSKDVAYRSDWKVDYIFLHKLIQKQLKFDEENDCYIGINTAEYSSSLSSNYISPLHSQNDYILPSRDIGVVCYRKVFTDHTRISYHYEIRVITTITWLEYFELRFGCAKSYLDSHDHLECDPDELYSITDTFQTTGHVPRRNQHISLDIPTFFVHGTGHVVERTCDDGLTFCRNTTRSRVYCDSADHAVVKTIGGNGLTSMSGDNAYQLLTNIATELVISRGLNSCCFVRGHSAVVLHTDDNSRIFGDTNITYTCSLGANSITTVTGLYNHVETHGDYSISCNLSKQGVGLASGEGSWLILSERDDSENPINIRAGLVGRDIEAGKPYILSNNEFKLVQIPGV